MSLKVSPVPQFYPLAYRIFSLTAPPLMHLIAQLEPSIYICSELKVKNLQFQYVSHTEQVAIGMVLETFITEFAFLPD
jgi:hypothetical protein